MKEEPFAFLDKTLQKLEHDAARICLLATQLVEESQYQLVAVAENRQDFVEHFLQQHLMGCDDEGKSLSVLIVQIELLDHQQVGESERLLKSCLRSQDRLVLCRDQQYLVLLGELAEKGAKCIVARIEAKFGSRTENAAARIRSSVFEDHAEAQAAYQQLLFAQH